MTQEEINFAFDNRWRIKAHLDENEKGCVRGAVIPFVISDRQEEFLSHIKSLCRDFFTAGILIGEGATVQEASVEVVCHDFDYWWNLYDLKAGKEKCMQKWNKMTVKDREACIAATPAYVAATPDKQYRKRPLTYLNQKAWNDEIIPRNNATNKPSIEQQRLDKLADLLNA